jgi:hypothetical protein
MNRQTTGAIALTILLLSVAIFSTTINSAKSEDTSAPAVQWTKTYAGITGTAVIQTSDQGYLIVSSPETSTPDTVLELIKTDSSGNQVWLRTYPGFPLVTQLFQTADGGYAIAGTAVQDRNQFFLSKLDSLGAVQWNYTYGDNRSDSLTALIPTQEGGYALLGDSVNSTISDDRQAFLVKIDSFGNKQWSKHYEGNLYAASLSQATDGGYVIAVTTKYFSYSVWLIKTDSLGNTQWFQPFKGSVDLNPINVNPITANTCFRTSDGGYFFISVIATAQGHLMPFVYSGFAVKTDANGDQQWNRTYKISQSLYHFPSLIAVQTPDDGYVLGYTDDNTVILTKTDSLGNQLWNSSYTDQATANTKYFTATIDGGSALTGTSFNQTVLIKLSSTANAPHQQLPPATPQSAANATILNQILLSGVTATSIIQTSDGGFIAVGKVSSVEGNVSSVLVKTDSSLKIQWSQSIHLDVDTDMVRVVQTQDGGYAVAGERGTDASLTARYVLVKYSSTGQLQWNQTLSQLSIMYDFLKGFIQNSDGGFLWASTTASNEAAIPYIVRINSTGDLIWEKSLTNTSGLPLSGTSGIYVTSLVQAADGGYTIIGSDYPYSVFSSTNFELIHLDANGSTVWTKSFGNQNSKLQNNVDGGIATSDGGYLLVGRYSFPFSSVQGLLLVKTDSQGNITWNQMLDGTPLSGAGTVTQTGDGGYLFVSYTNRYPCLVKITSIGQIQGILTLDSIFRDISSSNVADLKVSVDGAYVIAGQYTDFNGTVNDRIWLAKVAMYPGDIAPTATPTVTPIPTATATPTPTPICLTNTPTASPTETPIVKATPSPSPSIPEFPQIIMITAIILIFTVSVVTVRRIRNS